MRIAPLTGSSGLGPFAEMCAEIGDGALNRVLAAENVPARLIEPGRWLPLPSFFGLLDRAAGLAGDEQFGIALGKRMTPAHFGRWSSYCSGATDLGGMLSRYVRTLRYHQPGATFAVETRGPITLWTFEPAIRAQRGYRHHTDHIIWPMIRAVRRFAGGDWSPSWIEVGYPRPSGADRIEEALGARVGFGHRSASIGIAFPTEFLQRDWKLPGSSHGLAELRSFVRDRVPSAPSRMIAGILQFGHEDQELGIESIARILGLAPRTLQRALQAEGTTFSEVLAAIRLGEARRLLSATDMSVADVGYHIGYSYPPNFVRAFAGRMGMTPGDYRRRHADAGAG